MKIFFLIIFVFLSFNFSLSKEINIIFKIDNQIVTNIDLDNEVKYLTTFNKNLQKLKIDEIKEIAKNYIIKEKIKNDEIKKTIKIKDKDFEKKVMSDFIKKQGFLNEEDFNKFLNENDINYNILKSKIVNGIFWNQIIYEKFKNKLKINTVEIKKEVRNALEKQKKNYNYKISEILIKNDNNYVEKFNLVKEEIDNSSFETAANKFSISDSAKNGGQLGWIEGPSLSADIENILSNLKINEYSKPFEVPGGFLILKLSNKKEISKNIDFDKQVELRTNFEINKQLTQYSIMYYKKLEQNTSINEG